MNPADEARIDWAEYSAAELAAYDVDNPDESEDHGDGQEVWATVHGHRWATLTTEGAGIVDDEGEEA
jgi:hypothetical protein